jgi:uncharacterized membrane protein
MSRFVVTGVTAMAALALTLVPEHLLKWLGIALVATVCLYVGARLITAAYFQSKRQYDERNHP